uniref:Uncharacterized protein n=1 Tax=Anguilla anguilla TaxID=7936 RepID=A0A0E9VNY7_ANGAN
MYIKIRMQCEFKKSGINRAIKA